MRTIIATKKELAMLTKLALSAIDKRLSKAERELWQRQAWFMAKRIEEKATG